MDWLSVLCGCVGSLLVESRLRVLHDCGGISWRRSVDRRNGFVLPWSQCRFLIQSFLIYGFVFLSLLCLFCFFKQPSTILMIDNFALH